MCVRERTRREEKRLDTWLSGKKNKRESQDRGYEILGTSSSHKMWRAEREKEAGKEYTQGQDTETRAGERREEEIGEREREIDSCHTHCAYIYMCVCDVRDKGLALENIKPTIRLFIDHRVSSRARYEPFGKHSPATDVEDRRRRWRVWKSDGNCTTQGRSTPPSYLSALANSRTDAAFLFLLSFFLSLFLVLFLEEGVWSRSVVSRPLTQEGKQKDKKKKEEKSRNTRDRTTERDRKRQN